jgi:vancomycin resistance protein YoaR
MAKAQSISITDLTGPRPKPASVKSPKPAPKRSAASGTGVVKGSASDPTDVVSDAGLKGKKPRVRQREAAMPATTPKPTIAAAKAAYDAAVPRRLAPGWIGAGALAVVIVLLAAAFEVAYAGRIMPGVTADGVNLSGLSRTAAITRLTSHTAFYTNQVITVTSGNTSLTIPVAGLATQYQVKQAVDLAYGYGRQGNLWDIIHQQARTLAGRPTVVAAYTYSNDRLAPYLLQVASLLNTPVHNASLTYNNGKAQVAAAGSGTRLELGQLAKLIAARLATTSTDPVTAPVYQLAPNLNTAALQSASQQAAAYLAGPITITYGGQDHTVDQSTIVSWIQIDGAPTQPFLQTLNLYDLFPASNPANIGLNHAAIQAYVANLAHSLNQPAQNATLAMQNNQLTAISPSQDGTQLDQTSAVNDITAAVGKPAGDRQVTLNLQTVPAAVNENNLASLGITSLISEGETYFPGSPTDRLINVRAGAAKFNDVLLKPGQVFSFGAILGEVDASTGYVPELVIDGNHEDFQYGGGLCQVSTTAFRAALLAGLPIDEREGHSFAISYYTWPYGVPGVDATIYYPQVDLKFTNDTGHYILIQTTMKGDDLKFDYYGTKTKQGVIRGPYFITGTNDATKPSHTVFYRDVEDLSGNVIKTDTFNTYYQPSTNFPIVHTFN